MRRTPPALVFALTMLAAGPAAAESSILAANRQACDASAASGVARSRLAVLARGFNLPGWLEGSSPRRPDTTVLASLHARGFTHIRLPVGAERFMEQFSGRSDVTTQLAELDLAIDTLSRLGFAVSIDMHPGDRFGRLHVAEPDRALRTPPGCLAPAGAALCRPAARALVLRGAQRADGRSKGLEGARPATRGHDPAARRPGIPSSMGTPTTNESTRWRMSRRSRMPTSSMRRISTSR